MQVPQAAEKPLTCRVGDVYRRVGDVYLLFRLTVYLKEVVLFEKNKMSKVSFEDFLVEGLVQEGAWGKVFSAKRISDGVPLALV
jgi:hypothetical protein